MLISLFSENSRAFERIINDDVLDFVYADGKILDIHWSAIITYRDESIRIISVRRARDEEIEIYES